MSVLAIYIPICIVVLIGQLIYWGGKTDGNFTVKIMCKVVFRTVFLPLFAAEIIICGCMEVIKSWKMIEKI